MSAARIITTTEKFDEMGKLIERVTVEEMQKSENFYGLEEREIESIISKMDSIAKKAMESSVEFERKSAESEHEWRKWAEAINPMRNMRVGLGAEWRLGCMNIPICNRLY